MSLLPPIHPGEWDQVDRNFSKLVKFFIGPDATPTYTGLTLSGLTASRLVASDASKALVSSDLANWVAGTTNQITVTDDSDGTITLSTPQDIHSGASPTFAGLTVDSKTVESLLDAFNGTFVETIDFTVSESGGTVTGSLEQDSGGDLTQVFSDGFTTLDCTPAATINLTAYVGTDTVPKEVFIYILQSAKTTIAASNTDWPSAEHIKVANLILRSAATTGTDGALVNRNWNDHAVDSDSQGHITHIEERLRQEHSQWKSGVSLTLKDSTGAVMSTSDSSTAIELVTSEGTVYQLHKQTFPATDMYVNADDDAHVVNQVTDEGGAYSTTTDLVTDITRYVDGSAAGGAIAVNKYFNLVIWGVQNRTGENSHIMINLPTGVYSTEANATSDASGYSVYDIPDAFKGTGFLIARMTFRLIAGAQWTYVAIEDLRGNIPPISAGVSVSTTDHGLLSGLADDDHTQYLLADGTRALAGTWSAGSQTINTIGSLVINDGGTIGQTAGPLLTFDDSNNYLEITGGKVGIGITIPAVSLHVSNDGNAVNASLVTSECILVSEYGTAPSVAIVSAGDQPGDRGVLKCTRSDGTLASPTAPAVDDYVFSLLGSIWDGSTSQGTAAIDFYVDGAVSSGVAPQRISFVTSTTDGFGRTERLLIKSDGAILIPERASAGGNVPAYGQLWVKAATPNELWFTNDVGTHEEVMMVGDAPASHTHNGDTLQFDGVNSDGGAFSFTTSGLVTFSQKVQTVRLGIGTATIPHGSIGAAKLAIEGTDGNTAGPHVQFTTASNDYPLLHILPWTHDNINIIFDGYYDGTWKSSDAGSSFAIAKTSDELKFRYDTAAVGGTITWNEAAAITASGVFEFAQPIFIDERASAVTDVAGKGQFWVKNDSPCTPWFTGDTGAPEFQIGGIDVRSDVSSVDIDHTTLTMDGNWYDWDLSSIVPAGTRFVNLRVSYKDGTVGAYIQLRKNGYSNSNTSSPFGVLVANQYHYGNAWVPCDSNRVIEYQLSETFSECYFTVIAWMF
jgi:hypothetical protein